MGNVVGYVGKNNCWSVISNALERLEHRGYDSVGFACIDQHTQRIECVKVAGTIQRLIEKRAQKTCDGFVGIGHTRWATHGKLSEENSHPHVNESKSIALVHNGIIENHQKLRLQLEQEGHVFSSQTDTEILVHTFENILERTTSLKDAVILLTKEIHGVFTIVALLQDYPQQLLVVRKGAPVCIGAGDKEFFVASDPIAFAGRTKKVIFLPEETFALITADSLQLYNFCGKHVAYTFETIDISWDGKKHGHESFMLKEIFEQKHVIESIIAFYKTLHAQKSLWSCTGLTSDFLQELQTLYLCASGSSWHAASIGQYFFETITHIPTHALLASEARYMALFPHEKSLHIALSQSGETIDVLEMCRTLGTLNFTTLAITNNATSSLVRQADGFLLLKAGQEIAVGSTKSFTAQVAILYLLAHYLAFEKGYITDQLLEMAYKELFRAAQILELAIERYKILIINKLAPHYARYEKFLFIGRHISYTFALEAALKLKEISYQSVQCHPAGELKHGLFALIDEQTPVVLFSHPDPLIYHKLLINAQEIKSRNGHLLVFGFEGQHELQELADCFFAVPLVPPLLMPIACAGLMQIFVYYIAKNLGRSIDQPRHLAKSVTVE